MRYHSNTLTSLVLCAVVMVTIEASDIDCPSKQWMKQKRLCAAIYRNVDRREGKCWFSKRLRLDDQGQGDQSGQRKPLYTPVLRKRFNNAISAVIVAPKCYLQVWEHKFYQGATKIYTEGQHLDLKGWNDAISSCKCVCGKAPKSTGYLIPK